MDLILADIQWATCWFYLDDAFVIGRTFQEHLNCLQDVFNWLSRLILKAYGYPTVTCYSPRCKSSATSFLHKGGFLYPAKINTINKRMTHPTRDNIRKLTLHMLDFWICFNWCTYIPFLLPTPKKETMAKTTASQSARVQEVLPCSMMCGIGLPENLNFPYQIVKMYTFSLHFHHSLHVKFESIWNISGRTWCVQRKEEREGTHN